MHRIQKDHTGWNVFDTLDSCLKSQGLSYGSLVDVCTPDIANIEQHLMASWLRILGIDERSRDVASWIYPVL